MLQIREEKFPQKCHQNITAVPENLKTQLPYLYEISGLNPATNAEVRFYLLGSQHDVPGVFLEESLNYLAHHCDVLVKEVTDDVFGDAGDISLKELRLHGLVSNDDAEDWTTSLSSEAMSYFNRFIRGGVQAAWGISPHRMSPVVINHVVSQWGVGHSFGIGMDRFLMDRFESQGKPVHALEDGKVRFDAYETLFAFNEEHANSPLQDSVKTLEATILARTKEVFSFASEPEMADFSDYFSGDLGTAPAAEYREVQKRNLSWITTMENYLARYDDKTIVFMFGYAHLNGNYGILNLLANLGFKTKPLAIVT